MKNTFSLITMEVRSETDVVDSRQRARHIASLFGFNSHEQVRIATAVSEMVRNAFRYTGYCKINFELKNTDRSILQIIVKDTGRGIPNLDEVLAGRYVSQTGMGMGIIGAKRLMDEFNIETSPEGTKVSLGKYLPLNHPVVNAKYIASITDALVNKFPADPYEELQIQNKELLKALDEVQLQKEELANLNRELEDTNRGVVALYAELDEKAESLRMLSNAKTRFFSNLTHELRTPLSSNIALSDMLLRKRDGDLTEEQEKQVRFIKNNTEALAEIVNDLLDLAKADAGKTVVKPSEFSISDLISALRGAMRPLVHHSSHAEIHFKDPERDIRMFSDEGKISQILRNLVSNALKYTSEGEVQVYCEIDGDDISFVVKDTGIGIAEKDQYRIFSEFEQVDNELQGRVKGTGLGLPLSKKLAELLGGTITVRSTPGKGSTFTARIPLTYTSRESPPSKLIAESNLPKNHEIAATPFRKSDRPKILIIDDDESVRYTLKGLLSDFDFEILEAETGTDGFKVIQAQIPDFIFLDLYMPGMNGVELLKVLKANPVTQKIPVVIHTSKDLQEDERQFFAKHTIGTIFKRARGEDTKREKVIEVLKKAGLVPMSQEEI